MAKLTSAQLKALPDEMFGLPKTRQYPIPDEVHVTKAIQFFSYCKDENKSELAKNINRRAKELHMKIKVQPSSAFYKYADRSVVKEGTVVAEFHIGQLSPIVVTDQRAMIKKDIIEKTSSIPKLEKLRRLWATKNKTLESKIELSNEVLQECLDENIQFDMYLNIAFEGIMDLRYMSESYHFKEIIFNDEVKMNYRGRTHDNDIIILDAITKNIYTDKGSIINALMSIRNTSIQDAAVAYVMYNSFFSDVDKKYIIEQLRLSKNPHSGLNIESPNLSISELRSKIHEERKFGKNITDDDISKMESFLRRLSEREDGYWCSKIYSICTKAIKDDDYIDSQYLYAEFALNKICSENENLGYFRIRYGVSEVLFVKDNDGIYTASGFEKSQSSIYHIILVKVFKVDDIEYNDNVLSYLLGAKVPNFKIQYKVITIDKSNVPSLEANDFQDVVAGLQINKLGNISFILGNDRSWQEKYNLVKSSLEKNLKEENYVDYKNDLCFLFTLIAIIHRDYYKTNNTATGSYDMGDATTTFDKAIETFKSNIKAFSKIDPKFIFTKYYMDINYNNKIEVFRLSDDKELEMEIKNTYNWIIK